MEKLYPPYINGTIPAFYYTEGATKIVVPFTMNRAVAAGEVAGFALKIKTIMGDIKTVETTTDFSIAGSNASVTFLSTETFTVGQYYKAQLAYINEGGVIGYYSTVGVIKCTTKPSVSIDGLTFGQANMHRYSYTGVYSQYGGDVTEKMYSYRFVMTDTDGNIVADSGEKLHSNSTDTVPYESYEEFLIRQELDISKSYHLQFIATTVNKLVVKSQKYRIVQRESVPPDVDLGLLATLDFNNGLAVLTMISDIPVISGNFVITRASSLNDFKWEEIKRFDLHATPTQEWIYKDYTVEQGVTYQYAIQQYNAQGIYSNKILSNALMVDFEDMFLYDGTKQLRIRYNPKVSSFKTTLLEQKTDTIGSKYPFFSRNGNVEYKEFAISGLISYLVDEDETFIAVEDLGLEGVFNKDNPFGRYPTTNLVDYNIMAERIFKNKVLDWLNNGQVKLFKSPAEGNFLVRLMNVSLSPMDQLSRMLHTFNATAYEIADCTDESLIYYGLIDPAENLLTHTRWLSVDIASIVQNYLIQNNKTLNEAIGDIITLTSEPTTFIDIRDMLPGSYFYIDDEKIQIGTTGAYHYETTNNETIGVVQYVISENNTGQLDYGYPTQAVSLFGLIQDIEIIDRPARQFIGKEYLNTCKVWNSNGHLYEMSDNLLNSIQDVRTTILSINSIKIEKRPIDILYIKRFDADETFLSGADDYAVYDLYLDMECTELFNWDNADPLAIYRIRLEANTTPYNTIQNYKYYVDANLDQFAPLTNVCIDGNTKEVFLYDFDIFTFILNEESINLLDKEQIKITDDIKVNYLILNHGLIADLDYSAQIKTFNVEQETNKYPDLAAARTAYLNEVETMLAVRPVAHYNTTNLKQYYQNYIYALNIALDEYREENGLVE